jgi:uncharacterized protein (DUF924 family)
VDAEVRARFADLPEAAARGALDAWAETPRAALARVIALDQLPRNLHRGRPEAFALDAAALAAVRDARARGFEARLAPLEAAFLLVPYEHAEDLAAQEEGVRGFEALLARTPPPWRGPVESFLDFARAHRDVVARFGRFPHRNAILGRASTPAERDFLAAGGATYGQAPAAEEDDRSAGPDAPCEGSR